MPMIRSLLENISADVPKKERGKAEELDPLKPPTRLQTALQALYGHYEKTIKLWEKDGIKVSPCVIIVCQNTSISVLKWHHRSKGSTEKPVIGNGLPETNPSRASTRET
jgi:type III restriction enzyme